MSNSVFFWKKDFLPSLDTHEINNKVLFNQILRSFSQRVDYSDIIPSSYSRFIPSYSFHQLFFDKYILSDDYLEVPEPKGYSDIKESLYSINPYFKLENIDKIFSKTTYNRYRSNDILYALCLSSLNLTLKLFNIVYKDENLVVPISFMTLFSGTSLIKPDICSFNNMNINHRSNWCGFIHIRKFTIESLIKSLIYKETDKFWDKIYKLIYDNYINFVLLTRENILGKHIHKFFIEKTKSEKSSVCSYIESVINRNNNNSHLLKAIYDIFLQEINDCDTFN